MPSIEELYRTYDTKKGYVRVTIGGMTMTGVVALDYTYGISQVPTCTIRLRGNPPPAPVVYRASVQVDVGFEGLGVRVFTGRLYHINAAADETVLECMGLSWALDVPYHKVVKTFNNITAQQAIQDFLAAAGITGYDVSVPAWTIGTVVLSDDPARAKVTLEFQTYGEAITTVGEPDGSRWMELPTGQIIVRPLDPIPGLTWWREYFTKNLVGIVEAYPAAVMAQTYNSRPTRPRIANIHGEQQIRDVKNQVHVRGTEITQTNPDGTVDPITIEASASAPSPWVLNPDGTQAYNDELFESPLIDTVAKAQQVAGAKVTVKNRLNSRISVDVDADPEIILGRTVRLVDNYSRFIGQFFCEAYTTSIQIGEQGTSEWRTNLTLSGGSEAGGVTNINPFALFNHQVEREVIGDRVWAVLTLDGRGSSDLDGSIASWTWTSNNGNIVNGTGKVLFARVDPAAITPPLEVTLTVVDNLGGSDSITLTIELAEGATGVALPAMFVAGDTHFSASPDGGQTWNDRAVPADSCISVGAAAFDGVNFGVGLYGLGGAPTTTPQSFGVTDEGGSTLGLGEDTMYLCGPFAVPAFDINNMRLYVRTPVGTQRVRGVVYSDLAGAPNALLAQSAEVSLTPGALAWYDRAVSPAVPIAAQSIWIGYHAGDASAQTVFRSTGQVEKIAYGTLTADEYDNGPANPHAGTSSIASSQHFPVVVQGVSYGSPIPGGGGSVYRTANYCATALSLVLAAGGPVTAFGISYATAGQMWVVTQNGLLYRSNDLGLTWLLWDDVRIVTGKPNLRINQILTPLEGGVWVIGGDGEGRPLIAFDGALNHIWGQAPLGGELLVDLLTNPVATDLYIRQWGIGDGVWAAIILNSATFPKSVYFTDNVFDGSRWKRALSLPAKTRGMWMDGEYGAASDGAFQFGYNDTVIYKLDIVAGVGTASVAATALDAGDSPNFGQGVGQFIGGVGGAHIVCAEGTVNGTLYKTWDRFASIGKLRPATGFPAAPAGWNAKQIWVTAAGAPGGVVGRSKVAVLENTNATERFTLLTINDWSTLVDATGVVTNDTMLFCEDTLHYYALNNNQTQGGAVTLNMKRSSNGGATWVDSLALAQHMAIDAGGRLWAFTRPSANTYLVYSSDNHGATWTLRYTPPGGAKNSFFIACHPSNQNIIAIWTTDASANPVFVHTADRGAAWTVVSPSAPRPNTFADGVQFQYGFRILQNGRYVVSGIFTTGTKGNVMTSDDSGATWATRQTDAATSYLRYHLAGSAIGSKLVTIINAANSAYPWVSLDAGTTWAALALAQNLQAFTGNAAITIKFMVYDPATDTMYVTTNDTAFPVVKLTPVTAAGIWTNLKYDIGGTLMGNSSMTAVP